MNPTPHRGRMALYSMSVIFEVIMVCYVWLLGLRLKGKRLRDIIGGAWTEWWEPLRDLGIAMLFWMVVLLALAAMGHALGVNTDGLRAMKLLAPETAGEIVAWIVLSFTAGFCEEIMFRGYLQQQFFALTGRTEVAVILQGAIFGAAHAYQGWKGMVTIAVYGILFGILAAMRKSLRPGIIQHGLQDSATGIAIHILSKRGYI